MESPAANSGRWIRGNTVVTLIAMTVFYFAAAPVLAELWRCDPLEPRRVAARRRGHSIFWSTGFSCRQRGLDESVAVFYFFAGNCAVRPSH